MATKKGKDWKSQKHSLTQRRDAVSELKSTYQATDDVALLRKLQELKDEDQMLDMQKQQISEKVEAISEVVTDRWQAEGITSMNIAGVGTYSLHTKLYVGQADKEVYLQWLRDNGMEALIQPGVPPKTTESLVRERLEDGQPTDAMGLNVSFKLTVR